VPSVEARGKYRPHIRVRKTSSAGEVRVRLVISPDGTNWLTPDSVGVVLPTGTGMRWAEMPVIQIPTGYNPIVDGPSGTYLATRGIQFGIELALTASSSNLDADCLVLMPADDRYAHVLWPSVSGPTSLVLDSSSKPKIYGLGSSGETYPIDPSTTGVDSGTPIVSPNSYNRVWMLMDTGTTSTGDVLSNTFTVTPYYWPNYVYFRPAAS
jgi:hypothetical protein